MMQAGKLRHQVVIQRLVPVQDATTGVVTETWEDFATEWAEVRPASVREFIAANIEQSKVTTKVMIHYRPDVKPSMRIVHGTQVFNIEGVLADPKSGLEYLTLPVSEVQSG